MFLVWRLLLVASVALVLGACASSGPDGSAQRTAGDVSIVDDATDALSFLVESTPARTAARVAALSGNNRFADFRTLETVKERAAGSGEQVSWVSIYLVRSGDTGAVPDGCGIGEEGSLGVCNVYAGEVVATLTADGFIAQDCAGDRDELWCPTSRRDNDGDFIGVAIWSSSDGVPEDIGLFAMYFRRD